MNKIILHGRLGQDCQVSQKNDKHLITFSVATSERYKDKQGELKEDVDWHNVAFWAKSDGIAKYLKKGKQVLVEGRVKYNKVEDKIYTNIVAINIELTGGTEQESKPNNNNSDLPF